MPLELRQTDFGTELPVKARAGGRTHTTAGVHDGALKVRVTEPPERGKANRAIGKLLATRLGIAATRVRLIRGVNRTSKVFLIAGLKPEQVRDRLIDLP